MVKTKNRIGIGQRPCEFYPSKEKGGPYPPQRGSPRKAVGTPRNQKRAETGKPEKNAHSLSPRLYPDWELCVVARFVGEGGI